MMLKVLRAYKKILKASLLLTAFFVIISVYAPNIAPEIPFLPITGLIELLKNAEKEATEIIPDEIKSLISQLSEAVA